MRVPLLPRSVVKVSGPRCVVCHDVINGDPDVTIRGMHFHRRCASYKRRMERARR
jgi:hypothetical protein